MGSKQFDEKVKNYTPFQLKRAKRQAKHHYVQNKGEVSVKVLSRVAKVPQKYIRDWMKEEDWSRGFKEDPEDKVQLTDNTKRLLEFGAAEYGLTEQEELFCYHYMKTFNSTSSALKAGYSSSYAHNKAYRLLKDEKIKSFLNYIKAQRNEELFIEPLRIIQEYMKIAFADMTDFVKFDSNGVRIKNYRDVDGQLIVKIKEGRDGVSIELADKLTALKKLEQYLEVMPDDWKKRIEERKLELTEARLELDKQKMNLGDDGEDVDDGFIEALGLAKEVWQDEKEEE